MIMRRYFYPLDRVLPFISCIRCFRGTWPPLGEPRRARELVGSPERQTDKEILSKKDFPEFSLYRARRWTNADLGSELLQEFAENQRPTLKERTKSRHYSIASYQITITIPFLIHIALTLVYIPIT